LNTTTELPVVPHWIAGAEFPSTSGRTAPVYDPALGVETKRVALADKAEIEAAIASAQAAFPAWSELSLARRQSIVFKFRELLDARKGELAAIITSEHGKVLSDALGEISRGQEVVEFATGLAHHLKGEFSEQVSSGIDVYSTRQPLGVVGIISPFNFPARPAASGSARRSSTTCRPAAASTPRRSSARSCPSCASRRTRRASS